MLGLRAAWFGIFVPMMIAGKHALAGDPTEPIALRSEPVALRLPDCPEAGLDFVSLSRALRLELALDSKPALVIESALDSKAAPVTESALDSKTQAIAESVDNSGTRARIEVKLACSVAANTVEICFRDSDGKVVTRKMFLSDLPQPVRARAVALAAAELARSARASPTDTASDISAPPLGTDTDEPRPAEQATPKKTDASRAASPPKSPEPLAPGLSSVSLTQASMRSPPNRKSGAVTIALGPTAKFFPPASLPAWGGRAQAHLGRLHLGVDLVAAHVTNWRSDIALGIAEIGAGWELAAYDHPRFHLSLGPRIGAGIAWTPTHAWIAFADAAGASVGTPSPAAQPVEAGHTTLFLEGALASDWFVHLGKHWSCGLMLELGVARGAGATGEASYGEIDGIPLGHRYPLEAGNRTSVVAGASTLIGYTP